MADTFIITDVGLTASVNAAEQGLKLVLSSFKVGSAYGYTPLRSDTGLHGAVLYSDQITSFRVSSDGSLVATCTMAVNAGPFTFGEIGIYTQAGELFCLAALAQPQVKYSSLGTNIASTYSFDVFIKVGQATAVIEIDSVTTVTYGQVISALGYTPYNVSNPAGYLTPVTGVIPNSNPQFFSVGIGTPASGVQGSLTAVGNIYTTGNIQGFQTSDPKFKEGIKRIENPLEILRRLGGYYFQWSDVYLASQDGVSEFQPKNDVGMLATDIHTHYPIAARTKEDGTLAIAESRLLPLLIEGIRALSNEMTVLRNELATLKAAQGGTP